MRPFFHVVFKVIYNANDFTCLLVSSKVFTRINNDNNFVSVNDDLMSLI